MRVAVLARYAVPSALHRQAEKYAVPVRCRYTAHFITANRLAPTALSSGHNPIIVKTTVGPLARHHRA